MKLEIHRFGVLSERHPYPLVFIHGEWHGAWCWEERFVPYFRRHGFLCVTLDLRGHGGSEGKERLNDWTLNDYVSDMVQMVNEVGCCPILVGHSMGATVCQMFASENEVESMVLLCPIPTQGYRQDAKRLFRDHPWVTLLAELKENMGDLVKDEGLVKALFFSSGLSDRELCRDHCRMGGESISALHQCVKGVGLPSFLQDLPVLVIALDRDVVVSADCAHMCACQCHAQEVSIPGSGHDIMLDVGWEGAAETMLGWLDGNCL